jgi:hypothetical protein
MHIVFRPNCTNDETQAPCKNLPKHAWTDLTAIWQTATLGNINRAPGVSPIGAGGENRTPEASLENWSFTTKLRPRTCGG